MHRHRLFRGLLYLRPPMGGFLNAPQLYWDLGARCGSRALVGLYNKSSSMHERRAH
jgi:hypothetical protein